MHVALRREPPVWLMRDVRRHAVLVWRCGVSQLGLARDVYSRAVCMTLCAVSRLWLMRDVYSRAVRVALRREPPVAHA